MIYRLSGCVQPEHTPLVLAAGADFFEPAFVLLARMSQEDFQAKKSAVMASGLRAQAMNSMLPGDAVLYGTPEDTRKLLDFVKCGMDRAAQLGGDVVVFGSGTARNLPDTIERAQAMDIFTELLAKFCEIASPYRMRIAIEPLRASETNFIHTLRDAMVFVDRLPEYENLGVNADFYHMLEEGEPFSDCSLIGKKLFHAHISTPDRLYPKPGNPAFDQLYRDFFAALEEADYQGTISIEGISKDLANDLPTGLSHLRSLLD